MTGLHAPVMREPAFAGRGHNPRKTKKEEKRMKKIIAKEVNPRYVDFSYYFDDDGLKSIGGENCAVYIVSGDGRSCFNMDAYREIEEKATA